MNQGTFVKVGGRYHFMFGLCLWCGDRAKGLDPELILSEFVGNHPQKRVPVFGAWLCEVFGSVMVAPRHRIVCDVHTRMFELWDPKAKILIDIDCEPVISTRFGNILRNNALSLV